MFKPASKKNAKLRAAIFGPAGSGKTFSALRIATGMGGRIALIDTERQTACKYADRFRFDVCALDDDRSIDAYINSVAGAVRRYDVLIIDSLSHAWQELLGEVDKLAMTRYRGNSWAAWREGTPKQQNFVDTLLRFPGHVIATLRSKTEWQTANDGGKVRPVRVGLTPEQGKGIEYEFDLLLELSPDHVASVIKDRTGRYQDKLIDRPDEAFGHELAPWLITDEPRAVAGSPAPRGAAGGGEPKPAATAPPY